ncbi:MAG: carboxypeptidase-like regulatory domain-containing protein, partial [Casimicrobiaceae bacterium]
MTSEFLNPLQMYMISKIKLALFITAILFFGATVHAQRTDPPKYWVEGIVKDSSSAQPVSYATVNLSDNLKNSIASTFSNEKGAFSLSVDKPGDYSVEISFTGYGTRILPIRVQLDTPKLSIPVVLLNRATTNLKEIIVSAKKNIIEVHPGMLVYNAGNDLTNKGGTAADVLRKAPVLNVDAQGNVSMRGSSNLKILVDG